MTNAIKQEQLVQAVMKQLAPILEAQVPRGLGDLTAALVSLQSNNKMDALLETFDAARAQEQTEEIALLGEIVTLLKQDRN